MKIKNNRAVGWRPVLASVNKIRNCISFIVGGSETGHGLCQVELCQGRHLCVALHHMLLEKEAKPSREQLHSQIHLPGAWISIGKKCSVAATSSIVLCFEDQNCPFPYKPFGRCGGIKAGGPDVRSHYGKLGNNSWIVQHSEVVPTYASLLSWPLQPLEAWINKYKLLTEQWKQAM